MGHNTVHGSISQTIIFHKKHKWTPSIDVITYSFLEGKELRTINFRNRRWTSQQMWILVGICICSYSCSLFCIPHDQRIPTTTRRRTETELVSKYNALTVGAVGIVLASS